MSARTPAPAAAVPSPCIGVCRMHAASGWCEGCLRTIDEITAWSRLADADKRMLLQQLPARRVQWRQWQARPLPG
ncbi:MAG: DUF1289 domain-containing protein [Burkholderiales bacterium PBB5]|nr:MAG: DUF1289 domain-containing protein [Burkholderiales bacterium PBB5]